MNEKPKKLEKKVKSVENNDETPNDYNDKLKKLKKAVEAEFGEGSVFLLNDDSRAKIDVIPTEIVSLDLALGCGGIPRGRVVDLFGAESSGKSSLSLFITSKFQKQGLLVAYIDTEHAYDPSVAKLHGVDVDQILLSQPSTAEEALGIVEFYARSGDVGLIVVDSVAALIPKAELEGEVGDSHMALQARLMSQLFRMITGTLSKTNTTLITINQLRKNIGVYYGPSEIPTGGNAVKFYASQRLKISKSQTIKNGEEVIGQNVTVEVVKNKLAAPFKKTTFALLYGSGFDIFTDVIDMGIEKGIITQSGSWFSLDGEKLGQGKNGVKKYYIDNPKEYDKLVSKLTQNEGKETKKV